MDDVERQARRLAVVRSWFEWAYGQAKEEPGEASARSFLEQLDGVGAEAAS